VPTDSPSAELVTIRRYLWPHEAQVARSVLESDGIAAVVQDQHMAQMDWLYVQAIGGLRLQVSSEDAGRATELLDTLEASAPPPPADEDAVACPLCGSLEQERVVTGRRLAGLGLFGVPFWRQRSVWRCASCKRPVDTAPEPEPRL
jgi:hypothetical protein